MIPRSNCWSNGKDTTHEHNTWEPYKKALLKRSKSIGTRLQSMQLARSVVQRAIWLLGLARNGEVNESLLY